VAAAQGQTVTRLLLAWRVICSGLITQRLFS
jgi:hypothetical protein